MATYDMSPLDSSDRLTIKIRILSDSLAIDELKKISILPDYSVSELKFEVERTLKIPTEDQKKLIIRIASKEDDDSKENEDLSYVETHELSSDDTKLSEFDITQNTILELQLTDSSEWSAEKIAAQRSINMPITTSVPPKQNNPNKPSQDNAVSSKQPIPAQPRMAETDEAIKFLTKHSKIQCRILLVVFEITLILLIAYWGTISMVQYSINMIFVLIAWRGCRKLRPFWIVCFLLYLVLDIIILFLLIVLGIVEQHDSVYGSTAAYVILLTLEFVLNSIWLYWYSKFFYSVLKTPESVRKMATAITSKQPILV